MGFFKKRTTKSVGRDIGKRIQTIKQREKALRTLEKEEETRKKQEVVERKIREIKERKPTVFKKFVAGAKTAAKIAKKTHKSLKPKRRTKSKRINQPKPIGFNSLYG